MASVLTDIPGNVPADRIVDWDMYNPPNVGEDFHAAWKSLQDRGLPAILWTPHNGGHWIATRGEVIHALFADHEHFSNCAKTVPKEEGLKNGLIPSSLDPPAHLPFRMLLNTVLSPRAVTRTEPHIRATAVELIERFRARGHCDFNAEFAEKMPIEIIMAMMELPVEDADALRPVARALQLHETTFEKALDHFRTYIGPVIMSRLGGSGEDMLSTIINGKIKGRTLDNDEASAICANILIAGLDTVVNMLGFIMTFLSRNPAHRDELAANLDLIPSAIEEFLRRFPISTVGRLVRQDIDYDGITLLEGDMILLPTSLHGLDNRENLCPMDVDFHRDKINYSTFGNGPHRCPGSILARAELRVALEEWLKRMPDFHIKPGTQVSYTGGITAAVQNLHLEWDPSAAISENR